MRSETTDPKRGEREYFRRLGEEGLRHALGKPFTDPKCAEYLADMGVLMALLPPPPARGLDLGCGTGWTSIFLARRGYEVTAIDISPEAIEAARLHSREQRLTGLDFICADYEELTYHEEFDFAVFYDALHHAHDDPAAIASAYRALKPGGLLVTFEPGLGHHLAESSRRAVELYQVHEKEMPPDRIARMARDAGFSSCTVLPSAHDLWSLVYRPADGVKSSLSGWLERLRRCYYVVRIVLRPRRSGVVLLRK